MTLKDVINNPKTRAEKIRQCKRDGGGCAEIIMEDGWQVKRNYPW